MQSNNKLPEELLTEIQKYAHSNPREETCGIIFEENKNYYFSPCRNMSSDRKKTFLIEPDVLLKKNIKYIYHSHVNNSCKPSNVDIANARNIMIPFLIYSVRDMDFNIYKCV